MSKRLDHLYEQFHGPDAIWPLGGLIDVAKLHDVVQGLVIELRELEQVDGVQALRAQIGDIRREIEGLGGEIDRLGKQLTLRGS